MARFFRLCLTCCFVFTLAACGGNNDNNGTNNAPNTNNDTNNNNNSDTNNETTNNIDNVETNNSETNNNPDTQCNAAGEDCVEGVPTNAGFVCFEATCRQECDLEAEQEECRSGSLCLPVAEGGPGYCQPSNCDGWLDDTSCEADEQCIAARNDADICIPVGTGAEGDACSTDTEQFPCGPGTFCALGVCSRICGNDDACSGDERCIDDTLANGVGFCAVGCDSYSEGQCPDGQGCFPLTAENGVCDDVAGTNGYYQPCMTGMDQCQENSTCIGFQGADDAAGIPAVGRCLPFCDASADSQAAANATCPAPTSASGAHGRFVHLAEAAGQVDVYVDDTLVVDDLSFEGVSDAGAFAELTAGAHTVDITAFDAADNSAPLATVSPTLNAGDAFTWAIVADAAGTVSVETYDVPRGEAAPTAGSSKLRAAHAIPDFGGNVDVVAVPAGAVLFDDEVELALDLAYGEAGAFVEVPAADYDIYLFPAGTTPRVIANATGETFTGVTVPADSTYTAYARGTTGAGDAADPGLTSVDYVSAPAAAGRVLNGYCFDLSDGEPSPQSGFCIEQCPDSDTYGTGSCSGPSDFCAPAAQGGSLCFPGGPNGAGDACNPADSTDGCDGTSWCQGYGDGTGVCQPFCQPDTQSNPLLGCTGTDTCAEAGDNLGRCRLECTPDDGYADTTTCPESLQTCQPPDRGEPSYCAASGDTAVGGVCSPFEGQCLPGDSCINQFATNLDADDAFADGQCADSCDPFGDGSECGDNQVCGINWLTINRAVGHCLTPDENLSPNDPCQAELNTCGQRSLCLVVQQGQSAQCIQMCDLDDASTCSGTCTAIFQSTAIRIGACI